MRDKKWTFGISRIRLDPAVVKKIDAICEPMACSLVEEEYVKDSTGEGYKRYFYILDRGYLDNKEFVERLYLKFKEAGIELP